MKKRVWIFLLGACLLLAACGQPLEDPRDPAQETPQPTPEASVGVEGAAYAFETRVFDLPHALRDAHTLTVAGGRVFGATFDVQPLVARLHSVDLTGGDLRTTELPLTGDDVQLIGPRQSAYGELWLLAQTFDLAETEPGAQELVRDLVMLFRFDAQGQALETVQMTDAPDVIYDMEADAAGYLYLSGMQDGQVTITVYRPDTLTQVGAVTHEGLDHLLVRVGDQVYLGGWSQTLVRLVPTGGVTLGSEIRLYTHGRTWSGLDGRVYYTDDETLFSQVPDSALARAEFLWKDVDITAHTVQGIFTAEDGTIFVHLQGTHVAELTRVDPHAIPERTELILGTVSPGADLEERVARFNRAQNLYRVVVRDYNQYNTADNWTAGIRRLQADAADGTSLDLIDLTGLQANQAGLLDLFPLIDADDSLTRGDFVPELLRALERGGRLYELPAFFYMTTVVGGSQHLALIDWGITAFLDHVESLPAGTQPISPAMTGAGLVQWVTLYYPPARLDDAWFVRLLEYAETLDTRTGMQEYEPPAYIHVAGFAMRQLYTALFGELVQVGFPGGLDSAFGIGRSIGISAASEHPDAAWAFIRQHIGAEITWGFSILQAGLNAQIEAALQSDEIETWGLGGLIVEIGPITQADVNWVREFIRNTDTIPRLDMLRWARIEAQIE
ncbi:MAG: hypothetical protein FWD84_03130 [Oscillospiraceae bacterium]|nr:hypothetical protein [Oscillospiraceae bacterium]